MPRTVDGDPGITFILLPLPSPPSNNPASRSVQQCVKRCRTHPLEELLEGGEVRNRFQSEHRSYFWDELNQLHDPPIRGVQPLRQAQERKVLGLRVG